jgi:hypothetical protein
MSILSKDYDGISNEDLKFLGTYYRILHESSEYAAVLVIDPDDSMPTIVDLENNNLFLNPIGHDSEVKPEDVFYLHFDLLGYKAGTGISLLRMIASYWDKNLTGVIIDNIDALDQFNDDDAEQVKYWLLQMLRWDEVSNDTPFKHHIEFKNKRIIMRCKEIPEFLKNDQSLQTIYVTREIVEAEC